MKADVTIETTNFKILSDAGGALAHRRRLLHSLLLLSFELCSLSLYVVF